MDILNDKAFYDDEGEYGKYVLNKLILPMPQGSPESIKNYERYAKRVLWMDGNTTPGAFQLNASWYKKPNMYLIDEADDKTVAFFKPHTHEADEIVAFFSSDPEDQNNLGGEIIFYIGGEKHIITKSTLIFLPAGLEHGPLFIQKVDRPIFHFSCVTQSTYEFEKNEE